MPAIDPVKVESAPGQRVDGMEIDPALRRQQGILPRGAHAHAPASKAQEHEQAAVDHDSHQHEDRRASRDARAADEFDRRVGEVQGLQRMLLRSRPEENHEASQQDPDRDRGEDRGKHHLAGHLAHQQNINEHADSRAHHHRDCDGLNRMADEQGCGGEQQIGPQHGEFPMRHVHHPADAIDQHVAAGEQRVDRREHHDIDDELHVVGTGERSASEEHSDTDGRSPITHFQVT